MGNPVVPSSTGRNARRLVVAQIAPWGSGCQSAQDVIAGVQGRWMSPGGRVPCWTASRQHPVRPVRTGLYHERRYTRSRARVLRSSLLERTPRTQPLLQRRGMWPLPLLQEKRKVFMAEVCHQRRLRPCRVYTRYWLDAMRIDSAQPTGNRLSGQQSDHLSISSRRCARNDQN